MLVRYEMEWTVHYFVHKSQFWQSAPGLDFDHTGRAAYAQQQVVMWDQLAHNTDHSFKNINKYYKSPL